MPSFFWTQKQDIGPSRRTSHALAYDSERTQVVLFGGDPGGPPLDDTWAWDGALWTQVADTGPSARHSLAMVFDSARKQIVLFGGASGSNLLADTWTWNGTEWTQVADTGPAARSGHALAYDDARKRIVLFGGRMAAIHWAILGNGMAPNGPRSRTSGRLHVAHTRWPSGPT